MNLLLNLYITNYPSLIAHQRKCISLQQIRFQTQQFVLHQQMGHKPHPMILYLGQVLFLFRVKYPLTNNTDIMIHIYQTIH